MLVFERCPHHACFYDCVHYNICLDSTCVNVGENEAVQMPGLDLGEDAL